jgi:hypothetical protein
LRRTRATPTNIPMKFHRKSQRERDVEALSRSLVEVAHPQRLPQRQSEK